MAATTTDFKSIPDITLQTILSQEKRMQKYFTMPLDTLIDEFVLLEPRDAKTETEKFIEYDAAFTAFVERFVDTPRTSNKEVEIVKRKLDRMEIKADGGMASSSELILLCIDYPWVDLAKASRNKKPGYFSEKLTKFYRKNPIYDWLSGEFCSDPIVFNNDKGEALFAHHYIGSSLGVTKCHTRLARFFARTKGKLSEAEKSIRSAASKGSIEAIAELAQLNKDLYPVSDHHRLNEIIRYICIYKRAIRINRLEDRMIATGIFFNEYHNKFNVSSCISFREWLKGSLPDVKGPDKTASFPFIETITFSMLEEAVANFERDLLTAIKAMPEVLPKSVEPATKSKRVSPVVTPIAPHILEEYTLSIDHKPVTVKILATADNKESKTSPSVYPGARQLREARMQRYMTMPQSEFLKEFFSLDPDIDPHNQFERRDAAFTALFQRLYDTRGTACLGVDYSIRKEISDKFSHGTATSFEKIFLYMHYDTPGADREKLLTHFKKEKHNPFYQFVVGAPINDHQRDYKALVGAVEKNISLAFPNHAKDLWGESKGIEENKLRAIKLCQRGIEKGIFCAFSLMIHILIEDNSFVIENLMHVIFEYERLSKQQNYLLKEFKDTGVTYNLSDQQFTFDETKCKEWLLKNYKLDLDPKVLKISLERVKLRYRSPIFYGEQSSSVCSVTELKSAHADPVPKRVEPAALKSESEPASAPISFIGESVGAIPLGLSVPDKNVVSTSSTEETFRLLQVTSQISFSADEKEIAAEAIQEERNACIEVEKAPLLDPEKNGGSVTQFSVLATREQRELTEPSVKPSASKSKRLLTL